MKKITVLLFAVLMSVAVLAGCSSDTLQSSSDSSNLAAEVSTEPSQVPAEAEEPVAPKGILLMATTTSTDNTGLLDYLAPIFLEDTGWELQWTAVGTGAALQLGMDGEVDIILVHAKGREETFVGEGYGVERFDVMYNDFIIVGPKDGAVAYTEDVLAAFQTMVDDSLTFVSRGDDSGTNTKELGIWSSLGIDSEQNPNYISAGAGMSATIIMANEMQAYTLTDRATWLTTKNNTENDITLDIVCEGDSLLFNQYGVIAVNPEKYADVNNEAAEAFIDWICSDEIQQMIGTFGAEEFGQTLFTPNAQ